MFVPLPPASSLTEAIDRALERMCCDSHDPTWPARLVPQLKAVADAARESQGFEKFVDGVYQNSCACLSQGLELRSVIRAAIESGLHLGLKSSAEHYEGGMVEVATDGPVQ